MFILILIYILIKLIHQIIPTQERVARAKHHLRPDCKAYGCEGGVEDQHHALIDCAGNGGIGQRLVRLVQNITPDVDDQALLRLEFDVEGDVELPLVWLIAVTLNSIWKMRVEKSKV